MKMRKSNRYDPPPIAVVGISAIFPDAVNIRRFWNNILTGKDSITDVPPNYWLVEDYYDPDPFKKGKTYARRGAFLPKVDFDPTEFWLPPKTLADIDTVQLLSLIAARDVLNDCRSVQSAKVDRKRISVILGSGALTDMMLQLMGQIQKPNWVKAMRDSGLPENLIEDIAERASQTYIPWTENSFPGGLANVTAGRIANRLNLAGTNCTVDAACASSLGAVGMAVQELQLGHSDLAITGGADASNDIFMFMCFSKTPVLSRTGDCRPFSDHSDGTILGEGVGMVALRRLEDAERDGDNIYALVRGIGSSSDGAAKSIYAPLAEGQSLAIQRAFECAGFSPREVELVEAHGTATKANDKTEFDGLCRVFDEGDNHRRQWCALGSIKSQIGHTKSAAGAASLIKTVLALHHKILPPTIKVERPNPDLDFANSPFYLNTHKRPWVHCPDSSRKASLSAFGFGGSNFHLALEEYRGPGAKAKRFRSSPKELLLLSARDTDEMDLRIGALEKKMHTIPLAELARINQEAFQPDSKFRLALLAKDAEEAVSLINKAVQRIHSVPDRRFSIADQVHYGVGSARPKIAFLFPGQGSQYSNMGADLAMEFEAVQKIWDRVAEQYGNDTEKLHQVVFPVPAFNDADRRKQADLLTQTAWAQPAVAAVSMSQLHLLDAVGIRADCTAGHSCGEITALFAAGALTAGDDLMSISRRRGEIMARAAAESTSGAMTAVMATLPELKKQLQDRKLAVTIANINSPRQIVVSGALTDIEKTEQALAEEDIAFRRLPVSAAFHSNQMRPAEDSFGQYLDTVQIETPNIPVYANSTGKIYPETPVEIRKTLAGQIARPVLFMDLIDAMYADGVRVFLEVGPGSVLTRMVGDCLGTRDHLAIAMDRKNQNGMLCFWNALGMLASVGLEIQFEHLWKGFVTADGAGHPKERSSTTIEINGSNYGKPYPPQKGASALPKTIPEAPATALARNILNSPTGTLPMREPSPDSNQDAARSPGMTSRSTDHNWLAAFQELQDDLFRAHQNFQKTLTESHLAFIKATERALAELDRLAPAGLAQKNLSADFRASEMPPFQDMSDTGLSGQTFSGEINIDRHQDAQEAGFPHKQKNLVVRDPFSMDGDTFRRVLLEIVAEKTGYPEEVLDFKTDLESGFGIDSIKKMEILSHFQDRFPYIELQDTEALSRLNTLGEILEFAKATPGSPGAARIDGRVNSESRDISREIHRYVAVCNPAPASGQSLAGLNHLDALYIIEDNRGIAAILADKLNARGIYAEVVQEPPEGAEGVIFLKGINALSPDGTVDGAIGLNRFAFEIAGKCALRLREQGGVFVIVQDTRGDFGLSGDAGERAWSAGLGALAKTAAKEWPQASIKAIDIECRDRSAEDIARSVLNELVAGGPELEVGLKANGKRVCIETKPCALAGRARSLSEGDVVMVSGGARGITAACLVALAGRWQLKFAVLGRTPIVEEPEFALGCETDAEIKQAILTEYKRRGRQFDPIELASETRRIQSFREARSNIESLKSLGSRVKYFAADIRDGNLVGRIAEEIRSEWGDIRVLIHGASIISDKFMHAKTAAQFENVFATKVLGFRNLLAATRNDPLTHICCFSSVVARKGNEGQVDYAMANEVLNRVCQFEFRRRNGRCLVKALNWGPWDAGMVTPQLKSYFESKGHLLIPVGEGARLFVREMETEEDEHPVEVLLLRGDPQIWLKDRP